MHFGEIFKWKNKWLFKAKLKEIWLCDRKKKRKKINIYNSTNKWLFKAQLK